MYNVIDCVGLHQVLVKTMCVSILKNQLTQEGVLREQVHTTRGKNGKRRIPLLVLNVGKRDTGPSHVHKPTLMILMVNWISLLFQACLIAQ